MRWSIQNVDYDDHDDYMRWRYECSRLRCLRKFWQWLLIFFYLHFPLFFQCPVIVFFLFFFFKFSSVRKSFLVVIKRKLSMMLSQTLKVVFLCVNSYFFNAFTTYSRLLCFHYLFSAAHSNIIMTLNFSNLVNGFSKIFFWCFSLSKYVLF